MAETMGNLVEALARSKPESRRHCGIANWLASLADDDRAAVESAIALILDQRRTVGAYTSTGYTAGWLVDVLRENGHDIGQQLLAKHIGGRCSCGAR